MGGGGGCRVQKIFSRPSGLHLVKNKGGPPLNSPLLLLVNMCELNSLNSPLLLLVNMCELRCNILHFTVKYVPCFFLLLVHLVKNKDKPAINQKHYY